LLSVVTDLGNGTYAATLTSPLVPGRDTLSAQVVSGADTVGIAWKPIVWYTSPTSADPGSRGAVSGFALEQNFPNPFNPTTVITFTLAHATHVTLRVYDVAGTEVQTLLDERKDTGRHAVVMHASGLATGTYFYQLRAGQNVATRRLILLK
jgi:hypothetical protein